MKPNVVVENYCEGAAVSSGSEAKRSDSDGVTELRLLLSEWLRLTAIELSFPYF